MQRAFSTRNIFAMIVGLLVLAAVAYYSLSFGALPPADFTFINRTEISTRPGAASPTNSVTPATIPSA
jgi:hypothetical protein